MLGAFAAATVAHVTGTFLAGLFSGVATAAALGLCLERGLLRKFYSRSHLDQVLVTFGLILVFNDLTRMIWGPMALSMPIPPRLAGFVTIFPGVEYPTYRLVVFGAGLAVAAALYLLVSHTRAGMWVRAGSNDRETAQALGVNVEFLFSAIFAIGSALAGLAGLMAAPLTAVQVGMGDPVLVLALVVTVVGGIGSIRGAFVAAILIGVVDTFGRVLLPAALGSMLIFVLMAIILAVRPKGLFVVHG
jgi:branched-chain amino acid transport system permease protein